jgi:hypothetical protein
MEKSRPASADGEMNTNMVLIPGKEALAWSALRESHMNCAKQSATTTTSKVLINCGNDGMFILGKTNIVYD